MPRFCNKTFKRRKFGANYKDSSASEDLNKEQPASMYIKNSLSSSKSKLGKFNDEWYVAGHTSLVTAVSVDTGVIDAEILSRKCSCHFNGNIHSDKCSANYLVNSGGMEVEGALRIFNRSEVLHNLRYTQYLGDGDSKAYKAVLEYKPYKDVNIEKLECVGHVEKRMGTRLRAMKLLKGKKLEDKKSLGGRNRLTDAEIDKLQRYYGLAIRNNSGNLSAMKQAIWAIFFHKISTDLNPQHGLCPLGDDSWCGYNRSKLKGDTYKHKHNLPIAIMHCIKKYLEIFQALNFCLDVCTVRHKIVMSLNSVIWSIIPKTVFVQLRTLKTGVYESISIYNQGLITKLKVLDLLNIQPGFYTCRALQEADHARIRKAEKAISRRTKEATIKNRQLKCRQEDDLADDLSNPPPKLWFCRLYFSQPRFFFATALSPPFRPSSSVLARSFSLYRLSFDLLPGAGSGS
ncbi:uncharacterized protein TNCV_4690551 [Trichonephila clavipes]|nr:uncharacterized protein TNCV_4690551 [Trichonephila clavipes]